MYVPSVIAGPPLLTGIPLGGATTARQAFSFGDTEAWMEGYATMALILLLVVLAVLIVPVSLVVYRFRRARNETRWVMIGIIGTILTVGLLVVAASSLTSEMVGYNYRLGGIVDCGSALSPRSVPDPVKDYCAANVANNRLAFFLSAGGALVAAAGSIAFWRREKSRQDRQAPIPPQKRRDTLSSPRSRPANQPEHEAPSQPFDGDTDPEEFIATIFDDEQGP